MRVGILTSGGDCQALNVTMRGLAKTLYRNVNDIEIIGFLQGYKGLMYEDYKIMKPKDFSGIINIGGTILGTSRCPFKKMRVIEDDFDKVAAMKNTYAKLKLDCLVVLGGNGSIKSANMLSQEGLNVIALPKTIDNDVACTDITFGYNTAVSVATDALDRLHTTAETHNRIMCLEVMGRYAGWIALESAIAGGADVALIPEIPYDIEKVVEAVKARQKMGKNFSIVVVAEGAVPKGGSLSVKDVRDGGKGVINLQLGGAGDAVAKQLQELTGLTTRNTTLGYMQRGGTPTSFDRVLSTKYGAKAMELALEGKFGVLTVLKNGKLDYVTLEEVVGNNKEIGAVQGGTAESNVRLVTMDHDLVKTARDIGICLGD